MARTNIDVVITVKDGASQPLDNVSKKIKSTGKAAKDASLDFVQFNKTLFTTSAFIATFVKGITSLRTSMEMGGDLERLSNQYERLLGPKGALFRSIDSMTTTAIARMDALKAGVDLRNLGIAKSSEQVAEIIAKAGTAAKLSGIDAGEGIEKFTNFLKDGSVANLEALGLIKRTDPQFQALLATLNKAGGVYGTVISTQAKLNIGMALLNKRVEGQLKNLRDLKDLTLLLNDSFSIMKRQIGSLLGQALRPLIEKLIPLIYKFGDVLEQIRKNEKHIVFLVRAFTILTGSVVGLVAALGTLKLAIKLLGFAGFGLPGLIMGVLGLTSAFVGLTRAAEGPMEKLRVLGAIFKGIYELVTNLDPETGMSKISKSTKELLEKYGLLDFVKTISRMVSTIKRVVTDIGILLTKVGDKLDKLTGGIFDRFKDAIGNFSKDWTTWWVSDALDPVEKWKRAMLVIAGTIGAAFVAKKLFGGAGSLLSKIPGIGRLFGGGGSGPSGTASDPIYVRSADKLIGAAGGLLSSGLSKIPGIGKLFDILKQSYKLGGWKQILKDIPTAFSLAFPALTKVLTTAWGSLASMLGRAAPLMGQAIGVAAAGIIGWQIGQMINTQLDAHTQGETSEGFKGNIVERGFFKLFADKETKKRFSENKKFEQDPQEALRRQYAHAQKMGWAAGQSFNQYSAENQNKTETSVPLPDDLSIIQALGTQMKDMEEKDRVKMQSAVEQALGTQGPNGLIDPDEFKNFETMMTNALDSSENLTTLANKAKENMSNLRGSKRD